MTPHPSDTWAATLADNLDSVRDEWVREQISSATFRADLMSEADLRRESSDFLTLFATAARDGAGPDIDEDGWQAVRGLLGEVSRSRAAAGFSPSETAAFIFSLKRPLFALLQRTQGGDEKSLAEVWAAGLLLDSFGLFTTELALRAREQIIARQQAEMLELSTPVVTIWDGILALPLIGTLDSARTQVVMESLLDAIVDTGGSIAIIDITGVPTVDTLVAQHLLKTVAAARLMGAQCIISGIRPQIAQTMVHLGVSFEEVRTTSSLADALAYGFRLRGLKVSASEPL
jgi:rsbT co-antagonist protein RsbR